MLRRIGLRLGLDQAIVFSGLSVVRGVLLGPVTTLLIAVYFTPELQGFYYTFGSLIGLQIFLDLGLGQVITQFASHEWARLRIGGSGRIEGDAHALSRLISLGRLAVKWYAVSAAALPALLCLAGYAFFSDGRTSGVLWFWPWVALSVTTAARFAIVPVWALLEGCGQVEHVARYRFLEGALSTAAIWISVVLGGDLWTPAIAGAVGLVWSAAFLRARYGQFLKSFFAPHSSRVLAWRREVWPMQWRIALSWLSGYFIFSLFTPLMFRFHGPVSAGQLGMTWSLISALSGIASAWIVTKAPRFGVLIAQRRFKELDALLYRSAAIATGVAAVGALAILAGMWTLTVLELEIRTRLMALTPTALFLMATVLMQLSFAQSTYLRAHRREPFLALSIVSACLIGTGAVWFGRAFGATGMGAVYLAVTALFVLPYGTWVWRRCRSEWHGAMSSANSSCDHDARRLLDPAAL